mmetsp:Transcript_26671/g.62048  ORF Transcript_26671/g.62048 Transcript_26671/m.62048 type:complete len:99 (-) Transcript_26671:203-499(-)
MLGFGMRYMVCLEVWSLFLRFFQVGRACWFQMSLCLQAAKHALDALAVFVSVVWTRFVEHSKTTQRKTLPPTSVSDIVHPVLAGNANMRKGPTTSVVA